MLTLTFRRTHEFDTKDFYACRDKFNFFWKSLKRCKKLVTADLRYVGAIEFQRNGNVHFHILCHIPQVFKPLLAEKMLNKMDLFFIQRKKDKSGHFKQLK